MKRKYRILLNVVAGLLLAIAVYINVFLKDNKTSRTRQNPPSSATTK